jgi:hypothetical protein
MFSNIYKKDSGLQRLSIVGAAEEAEIYVTPEKKGALLHHPHLEDIAR